MSAQFAHLLPPSWTSQVAIWLQEDTPSFDYGGFVVGEVERTAHLLGKGNQTAVLAGVPFVNEVFSQLDCKYEFIISEYWTGLDAFIGSNGTCQKGKPSNPSNTSQL